MYKLYLNVEKVFGIITENRCSTNELRQNYYTIKKRQRSQKPSLFINTTDQPIIDHYLHYNVLYGNSESNNEKEFEANYTKNNDTNSIK